MEAHPRPQDETIRGWIGRLPSFSQVGQNFKVSAAPHQRIEKKLVDTLRFGTEADSRIEIIGTGFDRDGHGLRL